MNVTTENPREAIVIGQQVVSLKVAAGGNAEVYLGIIAPDAQRLDRDRDDLCDPFVASTVDDSSRHTGAGIHDFRPVAE